MENTESQEPTYKEIITSIGEADNSDIVFSVTCSCGGDPKECGHWDASVDCD